MEKSNEFTLHTGKMEDVLTGYPDDHFDSCVTDPSYGYKFMGKSWDSDVPKKYMWEQAFRTMKPGAYLLAFGGPRTYHRMVCGVEDAGFEIRDQIFWVFSSGFPKSSNQKDDWDGWGTGLKPAHEPIVVARKPLIGTVPQNLTEFGTGAMNIDACRIHGDTWHYGNQPKLNGARYQPGQLTPIERNAENITGGQDGRWPANLIHDGSDEVMALFPESKGQMGDVKGTEKSRIGGDGTNCYGLFNSVIPHARRNDAGSAARFFYCAKTSRTDRNEGCGHLAAGPLNWSSGDKNPGSFQSEHTDRSSPNNHPTVKPTDLMRYLIKLVTRPGGHILDPFCGSGSTGKAAMFEHMRFTGIDMDPHNILISEARIKFGQRHRSGQIEIFK